MVAGDVKADERKLDQAVADMQEMLKSMRRIAKDINRTHLFSYRHPEFVKAMDVLNNYKEPDKSGDFTRLQQRELVKAIEVLSFPDKGGLWSSRTANNTTVSKSGGIQELKELIESAEVSFQNARTNGTYGQYPGIREETYKNGRNRLQKGYEAVLREVGIDPQQISIGENRGSVFRGKAKSFVAGAALAGAAAAGVQYSEVLQKPGEGDQLLRDSVTEIVTKGDPAEEKLTKLKQKLGIKDSPASAPSR